MKTFPRRCSEILLIISCMICIENTLPVLSAADERLATQSATEPSTQPATQPTTQPMTQPATKPAEIAATKPATPSRAQAATQPAKPASATTKPAVSVIPKRDVKERYSVIDQRNIFLRSRSSRRNTGSGSDGEVDPAAAAMAAARAAAGSGWTLTGTALIGEDRVAFFEDPQNGNTVQRRPGEMIGKAKLLTVTPEGVSCQVDEKSLTLEVGSRLEGSGVVTAAEAPSVGNLLNFLSGLAPGNSAGSSAASGSSASSSSSDSSRSASPSSTKTVDPNLATLEERMRARRNQETSK